MRISAAIVNEKSGPFVIDTVELCDPRADEVIVRVVASGMCQTGTNRKRNFRFGYDEQDQVTIVAANTYSVFS
jgi:Zn-dependent alcohol dehydrogenase